MARKEQQCRARHGSVLTSLAIAAILVLSSAFGQFASSVAHLDRSRQVFSIFLYIKTPDDSVSGTSLVQNATHAHALSRHLRHKTQLGHQKKRPRGSGEVFFLPQILSFFLVQRVETGRRKKNTCRSQLPSSISPIGSTTLARGATWISGRSPHDISSPVA